MGKHEVKKRLGRPRRRWEDNIKKIDLTNVEWEGVEWAWLGKETVNRASTSVAFTAS